MTIIPRNPRGHGWLRPAIGVVELSQCLIQVLYLSFSAELGHPDFLCLCLLAIFTSLDIITANRKASLIL